MSFIFKSQKISFTKWLLKVYNIRLSTQHNRVLKRVELLLNDCAQLRQDRIQDQMKRVMLKSISIKDTADNIFEMLIDYYENVKWLVMVHQSEAQNQNRSVGDNYSVTVDSITAFAYILKGI